MKERSLKEENLNKRDTMSLSSANETCPSLEPTSRRWMAFRGADMGLRKGQEDPQLGAEGMFEAHSWAWQWPCCGPQREERRGQGPEPGFRAPVAGSRGETGAEACRAGYSRAVQR